MDLMTILVSASSILHCLAPSFLNEVMANANASFLSSWSNKFKFSNTVSTFSWYTYSSTTFTGPMYSYPSLLLSMLMTSVLGSPPSAMLRPGPVDVLDTTWKLPTQGVSTSKARLRMKFWCQNTRFYRIWKAFALWSSLTPLSLLSIQPIRLKESQLLFIFSTRWAEPVDKIKGFYSLLLVWSSACTMTREKTSWKFEISDLRCKLTSTHWNVITEVKQCKLCSVLQIKQKKLYRGIKPSIFRLFCWSKDGTNTKF